MRIYSMTATFGKLERTRLTLKPGLNVIEAPNEWGKSTWCAFLISMLYGIDTRAKSTRSQLADKERYLPWSGAPMEGSMDIHWNGRDITIQRSTKGRIPMGEFRAFETASGLEVKELDAENCGKMLLGVEKEVFTRAGFLRFSDLPVTEDEQLRKRLNALVTTGDESGSAELLEQKLKDLKNRCRYNRSGLLPQAQEEKARSEQKLQAYAELEQQVQKLQAQIDAAEERIRLLENHRAGLRYQAARHSAEKVQEAQSAVEQAQQQLNDLRDQAEVLPDRDTAVMNIRKLSQLRQELEAVQMEEQMLPPAPSIPEPPEGFAGCTVRQAIIQAEQHRRELQALRVRRRPTATILLILGSLLLFLAFFLFFNGETIYSLISAGGGLLLLLIAFILIRVRKARINRYQSKHFKLSKRYGCTDPKQWVEDAYAYARAWEEYTANEESNSQLRNELSQRKEALMMQSIAATRAKGLSSALEYWEGIVDLWDAYADSRCVLRQTQKHLQTLQSVATDAPPPQIEDTMTFTDEETLRLISDASCELRQLLSNRGQLEGQMEALGTAEALKLEDTRLALRIAQLEQTYAALEFALKSLEEARRKLQRRFSPRIIQSAQDILRRLTAGRYGKLALSEDFSVEAQAENEDVLRSRLYRSDGTVDQLYLALRLAVAKELTPEAPLILDDAMVRFDTDRLRSALEILKQESETKQVIVFTCQGRENHLLNQP